MYLSFVLIWNLKNEIRLQAGSVAVILIEIRPKKRKEKREREKKPKTKNEKKGRRRRRREKSKFFNISEQTQCTTCDKRKTLLEL